MNLLLIEPRELGSGDTCTIDDDRAECLRSVLHARVGQVVRAGVLDGAIGEAEVIAAEGARFTLRFRALHEPAPPLPIDLVLAVPRPKVLTRVIEACAAFAVRRIHLTNAWRVDKSYLSSSRIAPTALDRAVRLGAAQGATTVLPELYVHARLMGLLDAQFGVPGGLRLVAHPGAPPIEQAVTTSAPATIAVGPEGGWIERELDSLVARGFIPVALASTILRVESAVATALGQLALLHRMRQASPSS
jgi:RsmE family RNA methyltransferase